MCCFCCLPRCSIIFAGVWCLVQSIAWTALAVVGISFYTCQIRVNSDEDNHMYYLYFVYFFNNVCDNIPERLNFSTILENVTPSPGVTTPDYNTAFPVWPESFAQADYTHTIMWLYAIFNAVWAVTCFIVIVAAIMNVRNWFAYVPWILLTVANVVLDVVATIQYVNDAIDSETALGLLEKVIGLQVNNIPAEYTHKVNEIFSSMDGFTTIPSIVMILLTCRLGILWLLNVLFLICVPVSISRLPNKKGKTKHLTTNPHKEPRNRGFHNNSYIEETHCNESGPKQDYSDEHVYSRPHSYTGDDLKRSSTPPPQPLTNRGPASSVTVSGTNLHSPVSQPDYLELLNPQHRYNQPSAPVDNYEWQAQNRMPVPRDHGTYEQIRAPHIHRTDSDRFFQPSIKNRPAANIALQRVDPHSPVPETDAEYLGPRQGLHISPSSTDNYKLPPLRSLSVPHNARGNNGPDGQSKAPKLRRMESDGPPYRPPASTTNLQRRPSFPDEVDRPQDHNSNADRRSSLPPEELHNQLPWSYYVPRNAPKISMPIQESVVVEELQKPPVPVRGLKHTNKVVRRPSLPPEELRSQLPWSYFGPRNAPMKPKPIQESVAEEEQEKPPVPVPDYTLHFGKTARPVASKWADDGTSFNDTVASHRGTSASGLDRRSSLLESNRY